jgi:hypothetical protein
MFVVAGLGLLSAPASAASLGPPPQSPVVLPGAVATTLVASSVSILNSVTTLHVTYTARLVDTATGAPVAGQFVLFSDTALDPLMNPLANLICEPVTDSNGVASCTVQISTLLNALTAKPAYTATFFGASQYFASVANGTVSLL